jgi:hypothetical protein
MIELLELCVRQGAWYVVIGLGRQSLILSIHVTEFGSKSGMPTITLLAAGELSLSDANRILFIAHLLSQGIRVVSDSEQQSNKHLGRASKAQPRWD